MANVIKTVEQFMAYAETLPESVDRKKLAKALGIVLPVEVKPLPEQLAEAKLVTHTPKAKEGGPEPTERTYVEIPALQVDESSRTRKVWVRAEIAREAFKRGLELCDKHNL